MSRNIKREYKGSIFKTLMSPFPQISNHKTSTSEFLHASEGVVAFVDKLGKFFAPVRFDMNGNIVKLTTKYDEDHEKYRYLEDMIMDEKEKGELKATDALQWLGRGLQFLLRFFDCVLDDYEERGCFVSFMKIAYNEVLEPYHGWVGSQLFNIMCRFVPNRKEFFDILSNGHPNNKHDVLTDMDKFTERLTKCIEHLSNFYIDNNLGILARV